MLFFFYNVSGYSQLCPLNHPSDKVQELVVDMNEWTRAAKKMILYSPTK